MSDETVFHQDEVFSGAYGIYSQAQDFLGQLRGVGEKVDEVRHSWSGAAADLFSRVFDEWFAAAKDVGQVLEYVGDQVRHAGQEIVAQTEQSASAITAASAALGEQHKLIF